MANILFLFPILAVTLIIAGPNMNTLAQGTSLNGTLSGSIAVDGTNVRVNILKNSTQADLVLHAAGRQVNSGTVDQIVSVTIHKKSGTLQDVVVGTNFTKIEKILKTNIDEGLTLRNNISLVWIIESGRIHFDLFI
jgi:hypothetical protein